MLVSMPFTPDARDVELSLAARIYPLLIDPPSTFRRLEDFPKLFVHRVRSQCHPRTEEEIAI